MVVVVSLYLKKCCLFKVGNFVLDWLLDPGVMSQLMRVASDRVSVRSCAIERGSSSKVWEKTSRAVFCSLFGELEVNRLHTDTEWCVAYLQTCPSRGNC